MHHKRKIKKERQQRQSSVKAVVVIARVKQLIRVLLWHKQHREEFRGCCS